MNSPRPHSILTCSIATLLIAAAGRSNIHAQNTVDLWNPVGADSNYNNAANWSNGVPSQANNTLSEINTNTGNIATISADIPAAGSDIVVGRGNGSNGQLNQTAGLAQTATTSGWFFAGDGGGLGTYNLANTAAAGGTFTGFGTGSGSLNTNGGRFYVGSGSASTAGINVANFNTTGTVTVGGVFFVAENNGVTGVLNMDAGTVNLGTDTYFGAGGAATTGTLNLSGGKITRTGGWSFVGGDLGGTGGAKGTINISGGTLDESAGGDTFFGRNTGSVGNLNMTGGTFAGGTLHFGDNPGGNGSGGGTSTAIVGGTAAVTTNGNFILGDGAGANGSYTMGGTSTLTVNNGEFQVGNVGGTGSFTQNGGTVTTNNWTTVGRDDNDTGTLTINGGTFTKTSGSAGFFNITDTAGDTGTVNLNGGVLTVDKVIANGGAATASSTFNFNGGTLRASSNGTADPGNGTGVAGDVTFLQGMTRANVRNGGAVIDTNGFSITVNQVLSHSNVAGDNAVDGGLTVNDGSGTNAGMLTLTAANTYTGPTTINAGTLSLSTGSIASQMLTVRDGGTLTLQNNTSLADTLTLRLLSGANPLTALGTTVNLNQTGAETIGALLLDGKTVAAGSYTAIQLNSQEALLDPSGTIDFTGAGSLTIIGVPEPSGGQWMLAGGAGALIANTLRRRQAWKWLRLPRMT